MPAKYFILTAFFILATSTSYSDTDSKPLNNKGDHSEVEELYNKAWEWVFINPDSTIYYAEMQENLARKLDYKLGLVNAHYIKGYAYDENQIFDAAAAEYYKGLDLIKDSREEELVRKKAIISRCLGVSYEKTYNYDIALDIYKEAISIAKPIKYQRLVADLYYNAGVCYAKKNDLQSAFEYYNMALGIYQTLNEYASIAKTYNLIGVYYKSIKEFEQARIYYLKAIDLCDQGKFLSEEISYYISNIGETYFDQENFDSASFYYSKALSFSKKRNDFDKVKWLYNNLGDVSMKEENYALAIEYFQNAVELGDPDVIDEEYKRANKAIAIAYENLGDFKNSLTYHKKFIQQADLLQATKDKLTEQNSQYRMKEMEWMLERQAQKAQILAMQSQNFWFKFSISLLLIVLTYSAYKAIRYYKGIRAVKKWLAME